MCLGIPGKVLAITEGDPLRRMGTVSFGGIAKEVNLAFVPEAQVDDYVIVHVGFAISTLDAQEAERVFEFLHQLEESGETVHEEQNVRNPGRQ